MATKLVKIISNQSGPFTVNNNLVDITLPSYLGACDLSDTCVELDLKVVKASDGTDVSGLFDYGYNNDPRLDSTCLIKNVKFSSDKGGVLEEIAQPNVLHANLSPFETDFEARRDDWYYGQSINPFGTFINKVDSGSTQSTRRTALKLPLSSLLGIGKMKQFSNSLFGDCKVHLEFEDNKEIVKTLFQAYTDTKVYSGTASGKTIKLTDQLVPNGNNIWNGMPVNVSVADLEINGITTGTTTEVSLKGKTASKFIEPEAGDEVQISGVTGNDNANATFTISEVVVNSANFKFPLDSTSGDFSSAKVTYIKKSTVLSSSYSQSNQSVAYTVDKIINEVSPNPSQPGPPVDATAISTQSFQARAPDSSEDTSNLSYEVRDVHIIVPQYLLTPGQVNSMESKMKRGVNMNFLTYQVERINMSDVAANTQFDRQFDIHPGTINAIMLTPANNTLPSIKDNVSSFRWRLNGLEQTNRDIVVDQSLYNDRVMSVLSSGNIKVRNLSPVVFIAPQSIPLSPERQVLQIRLNQGGTKSSAKILYLYKQVRKAIRASNSRIEVV